MVKHLNLYFDEIIQMLLILACGWDSLIAKLQKWPIQFDIKLIISSKNYSSVACLSSSSKVSRAASLFGVSNFPVYRAQ